MSLQVTGKNLDLGDSFQSYVAERLDGVVGKYVGQHLSAHVRIEKERGRFSTSCSVRLRSGLLLEAAGDGADAYASADDAFQHLEKRLRRYKRRLKSRHHASVNGSLAPEMLVKDRVVSISRDDEEDEHQAAGDSPVVIAETERSVRNLAVSDAVMQLDLTDDAFLVFRNGASGEINVVYRRKDGNIGWIDPASPAGGKEVRVNPGVGPKA